MVEERRCPFSSEASGRALIACDRAIQLNPNDASAWHNRGGILVFLKRYDESLIACDRAIQLNPNDTFAWYNKASALKNLNRDKEFLDAYNQLYRLNPEMAKMVKQQNGTIMVGN